MIVVQYAWQTDDPASPPAASEVASDAASPGLPPLDDPSLDGPSVTETSFPAPSPPDASLLGASVPLLASIVEASPPSPPAVFGLLLPDDPHAVGKKGTAASDTSKIHKRRIRRP
jgi:hypothetical protein